MRMCTWAWGGPLAVALAVALSAGCGDVEHVADAGLPDAGVDAAPPGPCDPGGDPTYDEAMDCVFQAICDLYSRCFLPIDPEDCRSLDISPFGEGGPTAREFIRDAIEQGTIEYHPDRVADCYALVTGSDCAIVIPDREFIDICPIFTGTVADDGACYSPLECETPGSHCEGVPCGVGDCCAQICIPPAGIGEECAGNVGCNPGAFCVDGTCRTGAVGQPCTGTEDCDLGNWCDADFCTAELADGDDCVDDEQCPGAEQCIGNDLEGSDGGTCGQVMSVGDSCDDGCYRMICDQPDPTALGTCVAYGVAGDSCAEFPCQPGFRCNGSMECEELGLAGDPCANREDCHPRFFCTTEITGAGSGTCSDALPDDAECTNADQCQSGICGGTAEPLHCQPYAGCF